MATNKRENPGIGRFEVGGKEIEIRHATMQDLGSIIHLINTETFYSHLQQSIANMIRPGSPMNDFIKRATQSATIDKSMVPMLRRFAEGMVEEQSTTVSLDFTNARDIARAINDKTSIVAVQDGAIVGHMCSYSLKEFTGDAKLSEITHGVAHWEHRDGSAVPVSERKNIQNRTRYATLHNTAATYSIDTAIISITRQPLVATPLEASGFRLLSKGTDIGDYILGKLTSAVWSPTWTARYCTVANWMEHCATKGIRSVDDYNTHIARESEKQKKAASV